jgi:hypothetical protein
MPYKLRLRKIVRTCASPLIVAACVTVTAAQQTNPSERELRHIAAILCAVKTGDASVSLTRFQSGRLAACIVRDKDEVSNVTERHFYFYDNGLIKETGYQGRVSNIDISANSTIGTWYEFDHVGKLTKLTTYNNDIFRKASIDVVRYYSNGTIKAIEKYNNHVLYETDEVPIGVWKLYDERGKVVRVVKH